MSHYKRFFWILALTAMWSPSFLFIKWAVTELPPFTIVAARVALSTAGFLGILLWLKRPLPFDFHFWLHSLILALISSVLPFCLFCYAEKSIDSALAAILNGTTPVFTALLAHAFIESDKLNFQKAIGILMSFLGLFWLFAPKIFEGVSGTLFGMGAATLAAFCYALSHIYAKKYVTGRKPFIAPASQLLSSSLVLIPFALWYDAPWQLETPSFQAMSGILGLAFFGTFLAFIIYYKLIEHCGPTAISMVACFFPVCGMMLGFLFLGERMTLESLLASGLILLGMMIVNQIIAVPARGLQKANS